MNIRDSRGLQAAAARALSGVDNAKRLVLIWGGASAALALAVSLVTLVLDGQIADTGGLSGMGLRSVLSTVQSLLTMFQSIALPFWGLGLTYAMLMIARNHRPQTGALLEGFRRFGPMLRLLLLEGLIYLGIGLAAVQFGVMIFSMTPLIQPVMEVLEPMMDSLMTNPEIMMDPELTQQVNDAMTPMLIGCGVLFLLVMIPVAFRLRLAQLRLLEDDRCGALRAMGESMRLTRGNCLHLLKLDLRFWWFYLAQVGVSLVTFADLLLPAVGIRLPMEGELAFWLCYTLGMLLQLGVYYLAKDRVSVTYALAYDAIRQEREMPIIPQPQ